MHGTVGRGFAPAGNFTKSEIPIAPEGNQDIFIALLCLFFISIS